jgi:hypothetical protein
VPVPPAADGIVIVGGWVERQGGRERLVDIESVGNSQADDVYAEDATHLAEGLVE